MQQSDPLAGASRDDWLDHDEIQQQINKRLTINLLIAGAGSHAFLTAHHLVAADLEAIRPGIVKLYDRFAIAAKLNYYIGDLLLLYGLPSRFWGRTNRPNHPFHNHTLLARHGRELSIASKQYLKSRGWNKWVIGVPVLHYVHLLYLFARVLWFERGRQERLAAVASRAAAMIWGIDENRLLPRLTQNVTFGHLRTPRTWQGRIVRGAVVGYGGVVRQRDQFVVVGRAWTWTLVLHELVKGIAELVCLHGLNTLDADTYQRVLDEADQLEYENWMLQAGPEMWRRLLEVLPAGRPLAEILMHIARLDPQPLETLMLSVVRNPPKARELLNSLGDELV